MQIRLLLIFLLVCSQTFKLSAQQSKIDSLLLLLPKVTDTNKVNILNQLSSLHWYSDPQKTIAYATEAADLASRLNFKRGLATAYNNTGVGYYQQNKYEQAVEWYNKVLKIHSETGNFKGEAYTLSNIGLTYWKQSKLPTAVEYYLQSLKIWEDHNNEQETSSIFENLGNVYNDQGDYNRALEYYFKTLSIEKKYQESAYRQSMTLSNIGTVYLTMEKYEDALKYFRASLDSLPEEYKESRAVSLSNLGLTYVEMKDFSGGESYLIQALALQREVEDFDGMLPTLLGLSRIYRQSGKLPLSIQHAKEALALATKIEDRNMMADANIALSDIFQEQGDFKQAYNYYKNFVQNRDSILGKENIYKIAHLQAGYETEKKQTEIELLKKEKEQQSFRRNVTIFGLISLLIIAGLILSRQRLRIQQQNQLAAINTQLVNQSIQLEAQTKKLQEQDATKSAFFANISHEFRTPLTLILNSLHDKIVELKKKDNLNELEKVQMMHRNARRLLTLINQLLDLSKLEAGHMKLSMQNVDFGQLLQVIYASFTSLSHSRDIVFNLEVPDNEVICRLDTDKVEKMLFNLLSNAFKFTPAGGEVLLKSEIKEDTLRIYVRDSGKGIATEQVEKIFDRFYQGNQYYSDEEGTGIGLALTKELAELHGGKISVQSTPGKGANFILDLPLLAPIGEEFRVEKLMAQNMEPPIILKTDKVNVSGSINEDLPVILLVEDNQDLRNYIRQYLENDYTILETENGLAGLHKAIEAVPDLVITDWMMPEMDGITLCKHLKTDARTSHIPVILLTALATIDAKFKGLEIGADEYLTKPFDSQELQLRISNLIENRKKLRERFSKHLLLEPTGVNVSSMDEQFLGKVMKAIETHMGDPDFNMEQFGREVGLSRMQLHRKLKALTNESPGDLLRTMRLKRAAGLLAAQSGNVSEIAYEVGFNNLSYFSKCYKEQFGVSPNETASGKVFPDFSTKA